MGDRQTPTARRDDDLRGPVRFARPRFSLPSLEAAWARLRRGIRGEPRRPTRVVPQMELAECGAAALVIVLDYHGKRAPLDEVRATCAASSDGATAAQLVAAARQYGLVARGFRVGTGELRTLAKPAIAYWDRRHFLVIESVRERFGREQVLINDPASGRQALDRDEFDAGFSGVVLTFEPGDGFPPDSRRPRDVISVLARTSGARCVQATAVFAGLALIASVVTIAVLCGQLVQALLGAGATSGVAGRLFFAVVAASVAWGYWRLQLSRSMTRISWQRATLFRAVLRRPIEFFDQRRDTALARRVTGSRALVDLLARGLVTAVVCVLGLVLCAAVTAMCDPVLGVLSVGLAALHAVAVRRASEVRREISVKLLVEQGDLAATTLNTANGMDRARATGRVAELFRRWAGFQARHADRRQQLGVRAAAYSALSSTTALAGPGVILIAGGARVASGAVGPGSVIAVCLVMCTMTRLVSHVNAVVGQWSDAVVELAGFDDVERYRPAKVFELSARASSTPCSGRLVVRDLRFGYAAGREPAVRDVSFDIASGHGLTLVGPSGSGKSTVAKLVAGMHEPWSGEVEIGGCRLEELDGRQRARVVAFVDRQVVIQDGTVRDNITLWDDELSDVAVRDALRRTELLEEVESWPDGLDTWLGREPSPLSRGQRQRLELARGIVREPWLLVIDDALSELDLDVERRIQRNLVQLGCTRLVITQRSSETRPAGRVLALDSGVLVRGDSHEESIGDGTAVQRCAET